MADQNDLEQIYEDHDFGSDLGWGSSPALLVVDLQKAHSDPDHPYSMPSLGPEHAHVVENTNDLVTAAHDADVPVIFARVVYRQPEVPRTSVDLERHPALGEMKAGTEAVEIDDRLDVHEDDYVVEKRGHSAFYDTELHSVLTHKGVDTLVVTGCSTSGCVRATVVDACQHSYYVVVPEEAVGDRHEAPHRASLFDMDMKYADVAPLADALSHLESLA